MYCSRNDSLIYGRNTPLYKVLYLKKTIKYVNEMVEKNKKRTVMYEQPLR